MAFIKLVVSAAFAVALCSAQADVWQDCTAWYMGGGGTVGAFTKGDMTDIRHAADPDSPTHGGACRGNAAGISNLCEDVYSAASGRTFANQRTIYLAQRETSSGTYNVYENGVTLPFAATNNNYTLLMRVKLDEAQPHNKDWVYIADLGYSGGNDTTNRYSFAIRYYPETEEIGFLYNNGTGKKFFSVTNDVCTTLRGKWLELSVSLELKSQTDSKDECRMRLGVAAEGLERVYKQQDFEFPRGHAVPKAGKMYLAGTTGNGGASASCAPARGSYQMISYWERVLTDDEILEAFKLQGPDGTPACKPALLKVGDPAWGADVFGTAIEGSSATPSLDLQDLAKIPLQIAAGQTLNLPFAVPVTCTNLAQIVRLSAADGSAASSVQVKVDDQDIGVIAVAPGKTADVRCEAALFTEGVHTLTLTRSDAGAELLKLTGVEISGSWRLGWIDAKDSEMGGDRSTSAGWKTFAFSEMSTNRWKLVQSCSTRTRGLKLLVNATKEDAETRRHRFRAVLTNSQPAPAFDVVVWVNGVEKWRRFKPKNAELGGVKVDFTLKPGELHEGENEFCFMNEENPEAPLPSGGLTYCHYDFYELEVGKEPSGCVLIFR